MAPFDLRVKRLAKKMAGQMGEQTNQRTVHDMVRRDDTEKIGRMRYLYEVDIRDPALYDVVINTEKLPNDSAVEVIAALVRRPEMATGDAARAWSPTVRSPRGCRWRWPRIRRRASTAPRWRPRTAWSPSRGRPPSRMRWKWRAA